MKAIKITLLALCLLVPDIISKAQTNLFAVGGISTNDYVKTPTYIGLVFAPFAEVGFYCNVYNKTNKIGMLARYNTFNVKSSQGFGGETKKILLKNVISLDVLIGGGFNVGRVKMYLSGEGGLVLTDNKHGFNVGWRYDAVIPVTKVIGISLGCSADYYKLKDYKAWLFGAKAGIDVRLP